MQTKTSLGKSLGALLGGLGGDSDSFNKGQEAGAKSAYYGANAEQSRAAAAKAESERMEIERRGQFQTQEGMRNIAEISAGTDNDLARMIEQNLRKENVPLDSLPGGGAQDFYPGYKEAKQDERGTIAQLMAGFGLGDKSVDLQKIRQGVTENAVSGQLRNPGANVSAIANALSAFKGNAVDTGRGVAIQNVNEKPGIDPLVAALAALGKGEFNSGGISEVTGRGGQAFTDEQGNKVRMNNDDNSTSRANNASSNATSRSNNNADNAAAMQRHTTKGAGSKGDTVGKPTAKAAAEEATAINSVDLTIPFKPQVPLTNPRYSKFANVYNAARRAGDNQAMRKLMYYAQQEGLIQTSEE